MNLSYKKKLFSTKSSFYNFHPEASMWINLTLLHWTSGMILKKSPCPQTSIISYIKWGRGVGYVEFFFFRDIMYHKGGKGRGRHRERILSRLHVGRGA